MWHHGPTSPSGFLLDKGRRKAKIEWSFPDPCAWKGKLTCLLVLPYSNWCMYLQKLWLPRPSCNASDRQALLCLSLRTGTSHGRQRAPLLVTDLVPLYTKLESSTHSWSLPVQKHAEKRSVKAINCLCDGTELERLCIKLHLQDIWAENRTPWRSACLCRWNTKERCHGQGSCDGET